MYLNFNLGESNVFRWTSVLILLNQLTQLTFGYNSPIIKLNFKTPLNTALSIINIVLNILELNSTFFT